MFANPVAQSCTHHPPKFHFPKYSHFPKFNLNQVLICVGYSSVVIEYYVDRITPLNWWDERTKKMMYGTPILKNIYFFRQIWFFRTNFWPNLTNKFSFFNMGVLYLIFFVLFSQNLRRVSIYIIFNNLWVVANGN